MKVILFTLGGCAKCKMAEEVLSKMDGIVYLVVRLSVNMSQWDESEKALVAQHEVFPHLRRTAPVMVVCDTGEKLVGYLMIKRWLQNGSNTKV